MCITTWHRSESAHDGHCPRASTCLFCMLNFLAGTQLNYNPILSEKRPIIYGSMVCGCNTQRCRAVSIPSWPSPHDGRAAHVSPAKQRQRCSGTSAPSSSTACVISSCHRRHRQRPAPPSSLASPEVPWRPCRAVCIVHISKYSFATVDDVTAACLGVHLPQNMLSTADLHKLRAGWAYTQLPRPGGCNDDCEDLAGDCYVSCVRRGSCEWRPFGTG